MLPAPLFSERVYVTERDVSAWREAGPSPRLRFEIRSPSASRPRGGDQPSDSVGEEATASGIPAPTGSQWDSYGPTVRLWASCSASRSRSHPALDGSERTPLWARRVQSGLPALRNSAGAGAGAVPPTLGREEEVTQELLRTFLPACSTPKISPDLWSLGLTKRESSAVGACWAFDAESQR